MKYEEVQVGNWVKWYSENKWYPYQITRDIFSQDGVIENMVPIIISTNILESAGFHVSYSYYRDGHKEVYAHYINIYKISGDVLCKDEIWYNFNNSKLSVKNFFNFNSKNTIETSFEGNALHLHKLQQILKNCDCRELNFDTELLEEYLNKNYER